MDMIQVFFALSTVSFWVLMYLPILSGHDVQCLDHDLLDKIRQG